MVWPIMNGYWEWGKSYGGSEMEVKEGRTSCSPQSHKRHREGSNERGCLAHGLIPSSMVKFALRAVRPATGARGARLTLLCLIASLPASAQWMGKQTGCYSDPIAANPNRPTVANPADITQYGVLELEYRWDLPWPAKGVTQTSTNGLLKFAVLCDVELRWNTTSFLSQTDASGTHRTFGDNWLGPQVRFYKQTKHVPTMAFSYAVKIPSASTEGGLGGGEVDNQFTFLASREE